MAANGRWPWEVFNVFMGDWPGDRAIAKLLWLRFSARLGSFKGFGLRVAPMAADAHGRHWQVFNIFLGGWPEEEAVVKLPELCFCGRLPD